MNARWIGVACALLLVLCSHAPGRPAVYVASFADGIYRVEDLNGDGDALDAGEVVLWAESLCIRGLAVYGDGLLAVSAAGQGILLCVDVNGDGDALDAGEVVVWADGIISPYDIAVRADGTALLAQFSPGEVWRFRDLNGDGDALDTDEKALYAEGIPGPVGLLDRGDDVLVTAFSDHHVRRLVDLNGDGDCLDVAENMDHTPPDIPSPIGVAGATAAAYFVAAPGVDTIYRVEDRNGDGDAFDVIEVLSYADSVFEEIGCPWGVVQCPGLGLMVAEHADGQLSLIRDLNGDGDALDVGEVMLYADTVPMPTDLVYVGDPLEIVPELAPGEDWVYQNTQTTTQDRHTSLLTITLVSEASPGETYNVSIADNGPGGANFTLGDVTDNRPGEQTLTAAIVGGRIGASTPGAGGAAYTVTLTMEGQTSGRTDAVDVSLVLRYLGDVDGSGSPGAQDKQYFNQRLNGVPTPYPDRCYDLTGNGGAPNAEDKQVMNQVLNGVPLP